MSDEALDSCLTDVVALIRKDIDGIKPDSDGNVDAKQCTRLTQYLRALVPLARERRESGAGKELEARLAAMTPKELLKMARELAKEEADRAGR